MIKNKAVALVVLVIGLCASVLAFDGSTKPARAEETCHDGECTTICGSGFDACTYMDCGGGTELCHKTDKPDVVIILQ